MTGEANWVDPVFIILGGATLFLIVWLGSHAVDLLKRAKRKIICPVTGERVECTFVENTLTNERNDVERCSAFVRQPPACAKVCLRRFTPASRSRFVS
jgi:hypothetical protein